MNIGDIIKKKENKLELTKEEIEYVVNNYVSGVINDNDMTLLLNAITKNDMSINETYNLTIAMLNSGEKIDLSSIEGIKIDKHSTGGIGDKTTLVVLPLVASLGVKTAKMSGRGLGFTGGTIDKLESIPGFKTTISNEDFIKEVNDINMALVSQTENLVPADKKIYALRDVTGNVESVPLVASSIMSKKLASGSDKIVLDVKVGKGAFMKNIEDAKRLSKIMVDIGNLHGKETIAILTNMDYPLGNTIGNSLEVMEAYRTLDGKGNRDFTNLCIILASYMVSLARSIKVEDALNLVKENLYNGKGLEKFKEFIKYQGGDLSGLKVSNPIEIYSNRSGYLTDIDTMKLANLVKDLGAGRENKYDQIDHSVGVELFKHINDKVEENDLLLKVYYNGEINKDEYLNLFTITDNKIDDVKIVLDIIK